MARLNKSLVNDLQTMTFQDKVADNLISLDFNFFGFDKKIDESTLLRYGNNANVNRVLFWLSSKRTDYVREPEKGGVLYEFLGKLNSNTNINDWEESLTIKFNNEFFNDMQIVTLKLTPDYKKRKLAIMMVVLDKVTNRTFPVGTEASV